MQEAKEAEGSASDGMSTQWYRVLVSKDTRSSMHADSQVHWYAVAVVLCTKKGKAQCVSEVGTKAEEEKRQKTKGECWPAGRCVRSETNRTVGVATAKASTVAQSVC